jgi:hypothetical protein
MEGGQCGTGMGSGRGDSHAPHAAPGSGFTNVQISHAQGPGGHTTAFFCAAAAGAGAATAGAGVGASAGAAGVAARPALAAEETEEEEEVVDLESGPDFSSAKAATSGFCTKKKKI